MLYLILYKSVIYMNLYINIGTSRPILSVTCKPRGVAETQFGKSINSSAEIYEFDSLKWIFFRDVCMWTASVKMFFVCLFNKLALYGGFRREYKVLIMCDVSCWATLIPLTHTHFI